jgi:anti-anti-sigma factor
VPNVTNKTTYSKTSLKGWDIIKINGIFELRILGNLKPVFDSYREQPARSVALDLSDTDMIDSSAISLIVSLYKSVLSCGGQCAVVQPSAEVMDIFEVSGLNKIVPIYTSCAHLPSPAALQAG